MKEESHNSANKRIAKNTIALYLRMIIVMLVGLYTSRVVLDALGVTDYGIFNLVAGVVVIVNLLSSSLNSATSRFLTFSLGKGNNDELSLTFSVALYIHLGLSIIMLLIGETIGLWFVNTQLVIDGGRMTAANWAYQAALFSTFISISQVPYNATIISHERISIFAIFEIITTCLKLLIALLALQYNHDRLILYSILYAMVSILMMGCYRLYCIHNFKETHLRKIFERKLALRLLSFTGWNMFSHVGEATCKQGVSIILNRTFGTFINGAAGVALQVQAVLYGFIGNITTAFAPQIVKEYSQSNYSRVNQLIFTGTKLTSFLTLFVSVPVYICLEPLMSIWLKQVPEYSVAICRVLLIHNFVNAFNPMIVYAINATGKIRGRSLFSGIIYIANLVLAYIILVFTSYAPLVYLVFPLNSFLILIYNIFNYMKLEKSFPCYSFIRNVLIKTISVGFICIYICNLLSNVIILNALGGFIILLTSTTTIAILFYIAIITKAEKQLINAKIRAYKGSFRYKLHKE